MRQKRTEKNSTLSRRVEEDGSLALNVVAKGTDSPEV